MWPRLSLGKVMKLLHFSLSPTLFFGLLSYLAPFPQPRNPLPYVLDVFPGFLNTYSLSCSYSWISVNQWLSVLTDKA